MSHLITLETREYVVRNHFHDVFMSFLWSNLQTPARSEKPFHGFAADRDDNCAKECKNIIFHNFIIWKF